jgi:two-component system copper resistance phosphate regulon response regulator CusR
VNRVRVLLVDDSEKIRECVAQALRESGYAVDSVGDGKAALLHAVTSEYDAIVLDLGLPEMDGLTVLRRIRERPLATPVLVLTARDSVEDRVRGLDCGADDYLVKPFALAELIARVQALVRRGHGTPTPRIRVGPLVIDIAAKRAAAGRATLDLAPREYALLEYLAHRAGKPVSRGELEEHLYDERSQVQSNAVDSAVCSLRAKLEAAGCPSLIHTRRKIGYVLEEGPA